MFHLQSHLNYLLLVHVALKTVYGCVF